MSISVCAHVVNQLLAQFPDKPFIMDSRDVTLNARAFAAFMGLLQPQENKYLNDYFTLDAIRERMEAAKAKAAAALEGAQAPVPATVPAAAGAPSEKQEEKKAEPKREEPKASERAVPVKAEEKPPSEGKTQTAEFKAAPAPAPVLPAALLALAPASPSLTPSPTPAASRAPPLKTKEEMVPLASFVGEGGPSGIASSGLSLDTKRPVGEGLVLPRGRTVGVSSIPRGVTSAQLSTLLAKFGPVRFVFRGLGDSNCLRLSRLHTLSLAQRPRTLRRFKLR